MSAIPHSGPCQMVGDPQYCLLCGKTMAEIMEAHGLDPASLINAPVFTEDPPTEEEEA